MTTKGDFVQVSFSACGDGHGNTAFGSFRMTIEDTTGAEFVADARSITTSERFGLSFAFHDFATVDPHGAWTGVDGGLDVSFVATVDSFDPVAGGTGSLEFTVSGANLVSASGPRIGAFSQAARLTALPGDATFHEQGRERYTGMGTPSATRTESQWDLDAEACTLEFLGCLGIRTEPTFAKHESPPHPYPYAGAIAVVDKDGDFIQVTAGDEDLGTATLSWDIDGVSSSVSTTWACLNDPAACP